MIQRNGTAEEGCLHHGAVGLTIAYRRTARLSLDLSRIIILPNVHVRRSNKGRLLFIIVKSERLHTTTCSPRWRYVVSDRLLSHFQTQIRHVHKLSSHMTSAACTSDLSTLGLLGRAHYIMPYTYHSAYASVYKACLAQKASYAL